MISQQKGSAGHYGAVYASEYGRPASSGPIRFQAQRYNAPFRAASSGQIAPMQPSNQTLSVPSFSPYLPATDVRRQAFGSAYVTQDNPAYRAYFQSQPSQSFAQQGQSFPSYSELMSGYENDPLSRLYSGRTYAQQPPISQQEYDYLRLYDRYGNLSGPEREQAKRMSGEYFPGAGGDRDSYSYYQFLEGELKRKEQERMSRDESIRQQAGQMLGGFPTPGGQQFVHFLSPEMRRVMGVSDEDVARSRQAYSEYTRQRGEWDQYRQNMLGRNARQQQGDLQSAAARGFYQTPYSYQNI
jgi:hypothetical protein